MERLNMLKQLQQTFGSCSNTGEFAIGGLYSYKTRNPAIANRSCVRWCGHRKQRATLSV